MLTYHFPGMSAFAEKAAAQAGRPLLAGALRQFTALSSLANLCAQAVHAEKSHVAAILAEAVAFRDQLHAAARAADLILDDVRAGLGLNTDHAPKPQETPATEPVAVARPSVTERVARSRRRR